MRLPFCAGAFVFVYYYLRRGISHVKNLFQDPHSCGVRPDDRHWHRAEQHQVLHPAQRRQRYPAEHAALFTGFVNGCLQMLLGFWAPPTPTFLYFLGEVLLDYLVAFMALGTAEFFARPFKNRMVGVAVGTFMAGFLRFMCSFLSGVLVWGNLNEGLSAWTYSLVYNASYMLPETLLTLVAAVLLIKVAPQIFDRQYAAN